MTPFGLVFVGAAVSASVDVTNANCVSTLTSLEIHVTFHGPRPVSAACGALVVPLSFPTRRSSDLVGRGLTVNSAPPLRSSGWLAVQPLFVSTSADTL